MERHISALVDKLLPTAGLPTPRRFDDWPPLLLTTAAVPEHKRSPTTRPKPNISARRKIAGLGAVPEGGS
jgi:hypothetical protein